MRYPGEGHGHDIPWTLSSLPCLFRSVSPASNSFGPQKLLSSFFAPSIALVLLYSSPPSSLAELLLFLSGLGWVVFLLFFAFSGDDDARRMKRGLSTDRHANGESMHFSLEAGTNKLSISAQERCGRCRTQARCERDPSSIFFASSGVLCLHRPHVFFELNLNFFFIFTFLLAGVAG